MTTVDLQPARPVRLGVFALVALLHLALGLFLVRAFTPEIATSVVEGLTRTFAIPIQPPPEPAPPSPEPPPSEATPEEEGAAAPPGRRAEPRETAAPAAKIVVKPTQAPPVAGTGEDNAAGAAEEGEGTGAGGEGRGTGSGARGRGQGSGAVSPPVKIAGEINSAKDFPRESRDLRIGTEVIVALTVGVDGRVRGCRVTKPSPDPRAGEITCKLAVERFRFTPALDASGRPVEGIYGWRQRWFYR